jgi:sulfate transport system permease protein
MATLALPMRRHSVLPGFGLALGFALLYLGFIVLIPLSAAFLKTFTIRWDAFRAAVSAPRVVASYRLTFGMSFLAAAINAVFSSNRRARARARAGAP